MTKPLSEEINDPSEICNSKQYHITNSIQPHYVLLVLKPENYRVVYCSDNASNIFSKGINEIIGKEFWDLLDNQSAEKLRILLAQEKIQEADYSDRFPAPIIIENTHFKTEALFYRNLDFIFVELETDSFKNVATDYLDLLFLRLSGTINSSQVNSYELANLICKTLHKIIGFDRIWYCEFDDTGNGFVSGEFNNDVLPSLMHHRFPATDIPLSVRSIYVKNKSRVILDAYADLSLIINEKGIEADTLDLTYSLARRAGESHLEYLRNMGVASSASFSVVKEGKLVALFGAHSKQPVLIRYKQLAACQYLVNKYLAQYQFLFQKESIEEFNQKESVIYSVINSLAAKQFDICKLFQENLLLFLQLLDADGCLYYNDQQLYGSININGSHRKALSDLIHNETKNGIFFTDSLEQFSPSLLEIKNEICGILAIRLVEDENKDEIIIWHRKEHAYDEKWAGNPSQAVIQDESGKVGPRKSFESWVKTVEGKSVPWKDSQLKVAQKFRQEFVLKRALFEAKLQTEKAEKANTFKSQFLANMSHELRTPLHVMIGLLESIMEKIDSMPKEKQLQYLSLVHGSSERLLVLINDLLDLAKLEVGMMKFNFANHSLKSVVDSAINEVTKLVDDKKLKLSSEVNEEIKLVFDKERMTQVLINLLTNATKFTPIGKCIRIHTESNYKILKLIVSDQGIGIPENELETVFDKYVQSSKTKADAGGTGLGLSICKEIMQAHKGSIRVENNDSGGSSFFLEFPVDMEINPAINNLG
ncbi:MAG: GAF domain-containing protein [Methylomicrobium sp.]|nr:GAF domain-containing protein [Methylomicrobium sp.]